MLNLSFTLHVSTAKFQNNIYDHYFQLEQPPMATFGGWLLIQVQLKHAPLYGQIQLDKIRKN